VDGENSEEAVYQQEKKSVKKPPLAAYRSLFAGFASVNVIILRMIVLVITGTMGSGKTSALAEASDILTLRNIPHASIDLDALGGACLFDSVRADNAMYENLSAVSRNYANLGLDKLLIARAIETRAELDKCRQAVGATETVACRLVANDETLRKRIAERERGVRQKELIERVTKLNKILDKAGIEDFSISTEDRAVSDVAHEMLILAGKPCPTSLYRALNQKYKGFSPGARPNG
jgi:thymidine kinase